MSLAHCGLRSHSALPRCPPVQPARGLLRLSRPQVLRQAGNAQGGGKYPQVPPGSGAFGSLPPQPYPAPPAPSYETGMSPEEAEDQELLHKSSGTTTNLSFLAFWIQFALSLVSAGILLFSVAFVPRSVNTTTVVDASKYLTLVGVVAAFVSTLMAHGFLSLSRKLKAGKVVAKGYLVNSLLTNNAISLFGIGITVIGLQASVGTLVAKTLVTSVSGPITMQSAGNQLVSLDVFALQASTNTLLCHVIGLLFTNLMLRIVNKQSKSAPAPA